MTFEKQLSDVYWFQEGPGVRNWQFRDSGVKLLNVANVTAEGINLSKSERHLSIEEVNQRYKHFLVDAGDLVIASSGISFDDDGLLRTRAAFVHEEHLPLCMNTSTIRFKAKEDVSTLQFLKFWFDSQEFRNQVSRLVTGSAQLNFGPSHLEEMVITLPPLEQQHHIATILSRADRLRCLRKHALEISDSYLQGVFLELFGDPQTNSKKLEITRLEKHLDFMTSGPRGWAQYYAPKGVRFIRSYDVQMNYISEDDKVFVNPPDNAESRRTKVRPDDVLLTVTGSKIGRVSTVPHSIGEAYVSQHVVIMRLKPSLNPIFLSTFLSLDVGGQVQIAQLQHGQTKPGLGFEQIFSFQIPLPPLELQHHFAHIVRKHERLRSQQQEALRQAEHLYQTLLHQAFTSGLT